MLPVKRLRSLVWSHYAGRADGSFSQLAGMAQQGIVGEGHPGSVVPADVPEVCLNALDTVRLGLLPAIGPPASDFWRDCSPGQGELWKDKAMLIRGVGMPGKLTANCA